MKLTLKLTMFPALTSAARASEIDFCDIKYLAKYSFGYTFNFGKNTRTFTAAKPGDPIKFHSFRESIKLSVCQHIDLYIKRTKEIREQNS